MPHSSCCGSSLLVVLLLVVGGDAIMWCAGRHMHRLGRLGGWRRASCGERLLCSASASAAGDIRLSGIPHPRMRDPDAVFFISTANRLARYAHAISILACQ
jgi:hypothetical protein